MIAWVVAHKAFFSVFLTAVLCQLFKCLLSCIKEKRKPHFHDLFVTGGMPSTHSALVSSLLVVLFLLTGFSTLTGIAFVLFVIVIIDSMGVRRTAGEEAQIINKIIKLEKLKISPVHFALGHKPNEVTMGVLIGSMISILVGML